MTSIPGHADCANEVISEFGVLLFTVSYCNYYRLIVRTVTIHTVKYAVYPVYFTVLVLDLGFEFGYLLLVLLVIIVISPMNQVPSMKEPVLAMLFAMESLQVMVTVPGVVWQPDVGAGSQPLEPQRTFKAVLLIPASKKMLRQDRMLKNLPISLNLSSSALKSRLIFHHCGIILLTLTECILKRPCAMFGIIIF